MTFLKIIPYYIYGWENYFIVMHMPTGSLNFERISLIALIFNCIVIHVMDCLYYYKFKKNENSNRKHWEQGLV